MNLGPRFTDLDGLVPSFTLILGIQLKGSVERYSLITSELSAREVGKHPISALNTFSMLFLDLRLSSNGVVFTVN